MWDVYALNKWQVTGPDAQAALQRGFTNNLATQQVGPGSLWGLRQRRRRR